ncbi:MAG: type II secretion system protein GspE [Candidatus Jettenia sp.]|uniref:protein-secreting ATPase n=1 Tax=Candidatus Jettenia caeni TaxID=247490 RepID=I3IID8_9BACT|nr:MAG: type II secretion system protein GspE [Candidatus Jettenia sp. AMX1]MBC6928280.1 type II secretion system protein GspE [Candidatus Jettenia sp.]NUN23341.1 type II secretion system ATPase GspE [Candidatus Jettenia caeni]MCE7880438.1 type II secretion system protein GspE [Candidatus Jettenia sp. AMX1]MCQ3926246.1 type II secretion system protein GspE [Candidatus Jettenia sp.]
MDLTATYTIGDVLLEIGKVTRADLDRAIEVQKQTGQKLGRILIDLGTISEEDLRLAHSKLLLLPIWEKKKEDRYPLVENVPKVFLVSNRVLPLNLHNGILDVALADPQDSLLIETIALSTNKQVNVFVGCEKDILASLETLYEGEIKEEDTVTSSIEVMEDVEQLRDMASEAPVIRLVNNTLTKAIEIGASDVHLEVFEKNARLRYRVDGVLRELTPPPREIYNAIISRIKIMAKLNIAEKRLPQDGRIKMKVAGKEIDLRVSIIPMSHGEGVVMRILDRTAVTLDLEALGFSQEFLGKFRRMVNKPEGMLLVTGPTGSGKTTTLYAVLKELVSPEIKIVTVEDPVEYSMEDVNQIQVNPQIDLTFASGLRSILRHDPDIILIGEIRDRETASIAIQAALTGHLVFSTLHTNDSASAFTRLIDMGMEDYLISSCIIGILAQRLVRKICTQCRESYIPGEDLRKTAGLKEGEPLYKSRGCDACNNLGFKGRKCIAEFLYVDDAIRRLIISHKDSNEIMKEAVKRGTKTLWEDGLEAVRKGETTLDELLRVSSDT